MKKPKKTKTVEELTKDFDKVKTKPITQEEFDRALKQASSPAPKK